MQKLLTGQHRIPDSTKTWFSVRIQDMGNVVSGGTPDTAAKENWNGDVLWTTPTDITALRSRFITDTERKITQQGVKTSAATLLPPGTLLVCTRATIGYCAISTQAITTNQGFKSLVPNDEFNVEFLYYLFNHYRHQFLRLANGSTFLEISKRDFSNIAFEVPSRKEQDQITKILAACDDEISLQERSLRDLHKEKSSLMQQLLNGKRRVTVANQGRESASA